MAKTAGRLQAEVGRMLRAGLVLFGVAWSVVYFGPYISGPRDGWTVLVLVLPGSLFNLVALGLLGRGYALVWGQKADDPGHHKKAHRLLVAGTWVLVLALVLFVAGVLVHEVLARA